MHLTLWVVTKGKQCSLFVCQISTMREELGKGYSEPMYVARGWLKICCARGFNWMLYTHVPEVKYLFNFAGRWERESGISSEVALLFYIIFVMYLDIMKSTAALARKCLDGRPRAALCSHATRGPALLERQEGWGRLKAIVWFWWIDETLSANLVYQNDYEIGSTTLSV